MEAYNARSNSKKQTIEHLAHLTLNKDENGQYNHDDAVKFCDNVEKELKGRFNLLDRKNGMALLMSSTTNKINAVKSSDAYDATDVLRKSQKEAAAISQSTGTTAVPDITTRTDAQEEADRLNQYSQAIIGTKEGVTETFRAAVGSDVLNSVLLSADGTSTKGVDEYKLHELRDAIISGANRPKAPAILSQIIAVLTMPYDFRKKVAANFELQKANATKVQAYGITITNPLLVAALLANIENAQKEEWGREFQTAMQAVRKKYNYDFVHTEASLNDILQEMASADSIRNLRDAPEPESANAVSDQLNLSLLQSILQQGQEDYEEQAHAAAESSGSDSSATNKRRSSKKSSSRGRDRDSNRRRSKSRGYSRSRERPVNKCKHCKRYREHAMKHDADKCFFNRKYKGWRPKDICDELEIPHKPRHKFPESLGGLREASDSSGGSESE
jgi:hypothetical protein